MGMSAYFTRLRSLVGSELLLLPSITVLVENEAGEILLVRNTGADRWSTLGGMVEPEEHPMQTAVREAKEEADLDVELIELAAVCGGPECTGGYPNGDRVSYVTSVYRARSIGEMATADDDEISEVGWFTPTELAGLDLDRMTRFILSELQLL